MRPQQQNRRMRGRGGGGGGNNNNNNRKGPNPLTRSYESNGPDVKIRGTAQQVADKYATLARDAQSSGDRVMAENYLQHAEHYNRIIAAAMAQQQQFQQQRDNNQDDFDGDDEDRPERETRQPEQQQQYHVNGFGPQPVIDDQPSPGGVEAASGEFDGNTEQPGGNGHQRAEGDDGDGQQRRGRRQRRPMRNRAQGEGGDDAAPEAEAPQTPEAAE